MKPLNDPHAGNASLIKRLGDCSYHSVRRRVFKLGADRIVNNLVEKTHANALYEYTP